MANQRISELVTIATVDLAADLFPIVDLSASETKKITPIALKTALSLNNVDNTSDANKPISTATQGALDNKQATLISGSNIKTINSTTILGGGNILVAPASAIDATAIATGVVNNTEFETLNGVTSAIQVQLDGKQPTIIGGASSIASTDLTVQRTLVSNAIGKVAVATTTSTELGYVNGVTSAIQTQLDAKQATLISATNIKTINSTSLLGSGDIVVNGIPSGVSGAIQFTNGSAFASDAANLFYDDTNNRLGIGTNAPGAKLDVTGSLSANTSFIRSTNSNTNNFVTFGCGIVGISNDGASFTIDGTLSTVINASGNMGINNNNPIAKLQVKGSGTTAATTSFLVQNSAGNSAFQVKDNEQVQINFGDTLTSAATPNLRFSSSQTGVFSPNPNQLGIACFGNETARFIFGNPLHNGALDIGKFANPGNSAYFGWCSDGSLELTGNAQSVFVNPTNNKSLIVGGSTENTSAILQADSTTKGFLPPRMTTTQKNAIATIAAGLVVYDSTTNKLCCYNGTTWNDLF